MQSNVALYIAAVIVSTIVLCTLFSMYRRRRNLKEYNSVFQEQHDVEDTVIAEIVDQRVQDGKSVSKEMAIIRRMISKDSEYAWSWYCNLVMSFVDEGCDRLTAMRGASRFLNILACVDVSKDPRYIEEYARWEKETKTS